MNSSELKFPTQQQILPQPRWLMLFSMLYSLAVIMPSIFGYEMLETRYFLINGGSLLVPLIFILGDVVTEIYGYVTYKKMVFNAMICSVFFIISSQILVYLGTLSPVNNEAFKTVFQYDYRITGAAIIGITLGSLINGKAITKWRILVNGKYFALRSIGASLFGDVFEIIFVGLIGYIGILPISDIFKMMGSVFLLRNLATCCLSYPATLLMVFLKQNESMKAEYYLENYNPFINSSATSSDLPSFNTRSNHSGS